MSNFSTPENLTISLNLSSISRLLHAEDGIVEVDFLPAGKLGVEADPAPHDDLVLGRIGDPGEDLEERALASTVPPDDAEALAALGLEVDAFECPK